MPTEANVDASARLLVMRAHALAQAWRNAKEWPEARFGRGWSSNEIALVRMLMEHCADQLDDVLAGRDPR